MMCDAGGRCFQAAGKARQAGMELAKRVDCVIFKPITQESDTGSQIAGRSAHEAPFPDCYDGD